MGWERLGVNSADSPSNKTGELDLAGESITFSLSDYSVTLGSGAPQTATIDFLGFTGFVLKGFFDPDRYSLSGTAEDRLSSDTVLVPLIRPLASPWVASGDGPGKGFRIGVVSARFEASVPVTIPEPSSAGLVCLGVIGWFARRRRR